MLGELFASWTKVLTQPSVETFEAEKQTINASKLLVALLLAGLVTGLTTMPIEGEPVSALLGIGTTILTVAVDFVVIALIVFIIAKIMGGAGSFLPHCYLLSLPAVPLIAIAPVILIWFGLGLFAKTIIVAAVCFFPIAVNAYEGFRTVRLEHIHLLTTFGATRWQRYRHLFVPATLPGIFAGLKIAATYSVLGAVVGEWLGGVRGMGIYMTRALQSFRTDRLFAAIFVVMLTSYCLFKGVSLLGNQLTPWSRRR